MALTEEQKKEADKLGMTYELYEKLSNITIDLGALSGLNESLAQLNSAEGQAQLRAGIAANIGNINPLTMLGSDTIGPIYQPLTFTDTNGDPITINERNPTNVEQTLKALQDLEVPKISDVIVPQPPATKKRIDRLETIVPNPNSEYEISFGSNLKNELGGIVSLTYEIVSNDFKHDSGVLFLDETRSSIKKQLSKDILQNSTVLLKIEGNLPDGVSFAGIYEGNASQIKNGGTNLSALTQVNGTVFSVPANKLLSSFVVIANFQKEIKYAEPKISLPNGSQFNVSVKDSDLEKSIAIPFNTEQADRVIVYLGPNNTIEVPASDRQAIIYFQKDFQEVYGTKKIILVAVGDGYGTGGRVEVNVTFTAINDFPSITETTFAELIDVPSFSDYNISYDVSWNTFAATSVDIHLKLRDNSFVPLFVNQPTNGRTSIHLKTLRENFPNWAGSDNVTLKLIPYNRGGAESLTGNDYEIITKLILPLLEINEEIFGKAMFDAFIEKLQIIEPEKESKYLTHLANFGNDEEILISSWESDDWTLSKKSIDNLGNEFVQETDKVESIILKLYSPIPASVTPNSTFWVTKLLTSPLVETVILTEQDNLSCPPIKGPNFSIEVDYIKGSATNYESLDDIILTNTSSAQLVGLYLSSSLVSTDDLNIEYADDSTYAWDNFIHFSSAKERVDNFVYKVQLIENYESLISASYYDPISFGHTNTLSAIQEREKQQLKKDQLVNGFDGFEKFLYTSSSLSWPYNGSIRKLSTTTEVTNWYETVITLAENFDIENPNWVQNNIPQFIVNNTNNESMLLFLSMIGQHFDNIYFYTKSIEKSRGLGYKSKNGISDKLLFETLKSFDWDAKNLASDSKLWNYVFGKDVDGGIVNTTPAKQRTYEVWRRIVNNIPYLLKHKGTRKGIYALLSCYGIPSSNLSILEFGGPEVTDNNKSKLVMDNITTALKMTNGSKIDFEWKNTERNRKPDTIEFFVKPSTSGIYTLISGSGWDVKVSGSYNSNNGRVLFDYGSNVISSSLLPIFNGSFFGISVSREVVGSLHNFELNIRQADKERTLFQNNTSTSVAIGDSNWNNGSYITLGGDFIGSIDEFRLWSTPLEKERFYEHVSFPEMVNGNHVSASTDDLFFRLDFEYPKNLYGTLGSSSLMNVDSNIYFSGSLTRNDYEDGNTSLLYSENPSASYSASAYGFDSISSYPYNFEAIDRTIVLDIPNVGSSRYSTNKIRFEEQTLVTDLSVNSRATKKSLDQSPVDSNRVGLFFSPTKELNIDIAKSFGGINLDNYIGDPSDKYKSNYGGLDALRKYYFKRFNNIDIYAYINLIKLYEKSMFEDIKNMLPARVKATTGLLIEPHFLERSKIAQKKPIGENTQYESVIHYDDSTILSSENFQQEVTLDANSQYLLIGENNQKETLIDANLSENLIAENYQYDTDIQNTETTLVGAEYYQKEVVIDAGLEDPTILTEIDLINSSVTIGQTDYESIGFGIYAENGHSIRTYFDKDGRRVKERVKVDLVKERKTRKTLKYKTTINGVGDMRDGFVLTSSVYFETNLNIQPFSGSKQINPGTGSIIEVTPLNGYLPTHYRNTSDLTKGLQNSFYNGSKNTAATTLDGSSPIETFVSNPNTLKVNKAGRSANEPILEVE
jgi:hypothetical protein